MVALLDARKGLLQTVFDTLDSKLAIVVPVHNAPTFVANLKCHLMGMRYPVVWVDDASQAETTALICGEKHYLRNLRQQLFTRTSNRGIRYANRHFSPEYILVLNTDCELRDGWLESLVSILDDDPQIGIVGYDNVCNPLPEAFNRIYEPHYVTGHCLALRTVMLRQIGVFCETDLQGFHLPHTAGLLGLAHVGSDHLLSLRAMESGWKIGFCARDLVGHAVSQSWPGGTHWLSQFRLVPLWTPDDGL